MKIPVKYHTFSVQTISAIALVWLNAWPLPVAAGSNDGAHLVLLDAVDTWQVNRLYEPTLRQRQHEAQGDIVIYDGLDDTTVENVLDLHFARIQNMMFTRVVVTDELGDPLRDKEGELVVEDDGC